MSRLGRMDMRNNPPSHLTRSILLTIIIMLCISPSLSYFAKEKGYIMLRITFSVVLLLVLVNVVFAAKVIQHYPETTDPAEAAKDPDFKIQGEYVGEGTWSDGANAKVGAQAIALGNGQFAVAVFKGGLPGDGWKRGEPKFSLDGRRGGDAVALTGDGFLGTIAEQAMTLSGSDGKAKLELKRTERHSPTENAKPPEGAVVLFDGTTADNFTDGILLPDKNLFAGATTKQSFGDYTLHAEFRLSYMPEARGQARSNSGVYLHNSYEIQVLDSFGLEGKIDECGGFYSIREPDVNMCFPPLTWQTYDVDFTAPRYEGDKKMANAKVLVKHNGVVIHPLFELPHHTPLGRQNEKEGPAPRRIYFQLHDGNKVEYRNIWLKEK